MQNNFYLSSDAFLGQKSLIRILCFFFITSCYTGLFGQIKVDENNNVGIGTTTPNSKLHVVGRITPKFPTSDKDNIVLGQGAGNVNQTGINNILLGSEAGSSLTNGINNFFAGYQAGKYFTGHTTFNAYSNIFIGSQAGLNSETNALNNIFLGYLSGKSNVLGGSNIFIGALSGTNNTGSSNVYIGSKAGEATVNGIFNTFVGNVAGSVNLGIRNTFIGHAAGNSNNDGNCNVFVGSNTGLTNTEGDSVICLGILANVAVNDLVSATSIGSKSIVNESDKIWLGKSTTNFIGGVREWNIPSDSRFKENISDNIPGISFITQLKPVSYNFSAEKFTQHLVSMMPDSLKQIYLDENFEPSYSLRRVGFLAQEVDQICTSMGFDFDGITKPDPNNPTSHYSISYSSFVVPLVKAVQEQQVMISNLTAQNQQLVNQLNALTLRVTALER